MSLYKVVSAASFVVAAGALSYSAYCMHHIAKAEKLRMACALLSSEPGFSSDISRENAKELSKDGRSEFVLTRGNAIQEWVSIVESSYGRATGLQPAVICSAYTGISANQYLPKPRP